MAATSNESDSPRKNPENKENDNKDEQSNVFECNICLDNAKDAVVSVCGHLFWFVLFPKLKVSNISFYTYQP